jgi:thiol-disulfide isomerase/thioredoxin
VRPAVDDIEAPPFPGRLTWINSGALRMESQRGRPVLVEFWDFCRPNSLRTIPYLQAWHERYAGQGLRVIGIHAAGFQCSRDPDCVRSAVARLGIEYPVVVDTEYDLWGMYGVEGWPSRYLWNADGRLADYHFGEGAYADTERAIQELLGVEGQPTVSPLRPGDEPGALLPAQSEDLPGAYSGPYEAGAVWAVLEGRGTVVADGRQIPVEHTGCYLLVEHPHHTGGELELEVGDGVTCHAVCFTPGVAPA